MSVAKEGLKDVSQTLQQSVANAGSDVSLTRQVSLMVEYCEMNES